MLDFDCILTTRGKAAAPRDRRFATLRAIKPSFSPLRSWTIALALVLAAMIAPVSGQQNLQPRIPKAKLTLPQLLAMPATNRVVLKLREGSQISLKDGQLIDTATAAVDEVQNVIRQMGISTPLRRLFDSLSEAEVNAQHEEAQRNSGRELANLNLYFVLTLPPNLTAAEVANRLNALPSVEYAEPGPLPHPPPAATR